MLRFKSLIVAALTMSLMAAPAFAQTKGEAKAEDKAAKVEVKADDKVAKTEGKTEGTAKVDDKAAKTEDAAAAKVEKDGPKKNGHKGPKPEKGGKK